MVSLPSLVGIAAVISAVALAVAWLRRLTAREIGFDALAASLAALGATFAADALYALSHPSGSSPVWHHLGSLALLAASVASVAALRVRGRRSTPRALVGAGVAVAAVFLWLTLHLKGVRGGWTAGEIVVATVASAVAVGSGACLGWWSKRARGGERGESVTPSPAPGGSVAR